MYYQCFKFLPTWYKVLPDWPIWYIFKFCFFDTKEIEYIFKHLVEISILLRNLYIFLNVFHWVVSMFLVDVSVQFTCSVVSDSLQPHGLKPAKLLYPWEFSREEFWSGLPCPPPGDLPNPGIKPRSRPHYRQILYHLSHQGIPVHALVGLSTGIWSNAIESPLKFVFPVLINWPFLGCRLKLTHAHTHTHNIHTTFYCVLTFFPL